MSLEKCSCHINDKVTAENFIEAEKMIMAGIIARISRKIKDEYKKQSGAIAAAVVRKIFDIPPQSDDEAGFFRQYETEINSIIGKLSEEREVCDILTQAFIMRIVYASKLSGCKTEQLYSSINILKELGLYYESGTPPTPGTFFSRAQAFFLASPKS
jgi:hypothetical protein